MQRLLSEVAEQVHFGREKAGAGAIQRSDALTRLGRRGTRDPSELPEQAVQNQHQSEFYRLFTQLPGPTIPRAAGTRAVSQRSGGTDRFLFPHSHSSAYSKQASAARRGSIENRTSEKKPSLVPLDMRTQVGEGMGVHPVGTGLCSARASDEISTSERSRAPPLQNLCKTRISLQLTAPMRTENARTAGAVRAFDFGDQPIPPRAAPATRATMQRMQ